MGIPKTYLQGDRGPLLGAHMSIAGGYDQAVIRARAATCDCVQLFTKNNNQWRAKPISDEEVSAFQLALRDHRIRAPLSHASYLINIASPERELWERSVAGLTLELERAERLGLFGVVLHPGAAMGTSEPSAIQRAVRGLNRALKDTSGANVLCLLETTAGQGSTLGGRFQHLASLLERARFPERLGVCVDTCHIFVAGYPLVTPADYQGTFQEFDHVIGLNRIRAFHLNDSKKPLGSRVDRHEHIGRGNLGLKPFRQLLNDPRFFAVPMYLETPKGMENGRDLDRINLMRLRRLIVKPPAGR